VIDQAIPAEAAPSVAADTAAAKVMPETQTSPEIAGAVYQVPNTQIASRPEIMQFKRMDEATTGTNEADRITAPYDPIKAGNLLLWEPNNPQDYGLTNEQKYIVANGHHRNAAAQAQGSKLRTLKSFANLPALVPRTPQLSQPRQISQTAKAPSTTRLSSSETNQQHTERMLHWQERHKSALAAGKLLPLQRRPGLISTPVSSTNK